MDKLAALDGSVQSQGVKLSVRDWLDMGSPTWKTTPDRDKAAAYQAARVCGWTDQGLILLLAEAFGPRIQAEDAALVVGILADLAKQYPCEVEQLYETNIQSLQ